MILEATKQEIETTTVEGMYRVSDSVVMIERLYDPTLDDFVDGETALYARVDRQHEMPVGADESFIRPDGYRVIFQRCLIEDIARRERASQQVSA